MDRTDILFNQPSALNGVARTIDLYATYTEYNYSKSSEEADRIAIFSDINVIRKDFNNAFQYFKKYYGKKRK